MCSLFFPFATKLLLHAFSQSKPFTHEYYLPHCCRFLRLQMLAGIHFFKELWPSVWRKEGCDSERQNSQINGLSKREVIFS